MTLLELGEADSEKSSPVPVSSIACGSGEALSVISINPTAEPPAGGTKVTLKVQLDPAARVAEPVGQVLVSANVPVSMTLENVSAASPEFVSVTTCGALVVVAS